MKVIFKQTKLYYIINMTGFERTCNGKVSACNSHQFWSIYGLTVEWIAS